MDVEEIDVSYIVDRNLKWEIHSGKHKWAIMKSYHEKKMEETYMYFTKWKQLI